MEIQWNKSLPLHGTTLLDECDWWRPPGEPEKSASLQDALQERKPLKGITWECIGSLFHKRVSDLPASPDPGHSSDWNWQCKRKQEWNWKKRMV